MNSRIARHGGRLIFARPLSSQFPRKVHWQTVSCQHRRNLSSKATATLDGSNNDDPSALANSKQQPQQQNATTTSAIRWNEQDPPLSSSSSSSSPPRVQVHNLLSHGCLSYPQTWAYQQFLLHRRLQQRRGQSSHQTNNYDCDCLVLLEHAPVYTLGRGADEKHLTFVQGHEQNKVVERLSRKVRGPGTARLSLDRDMEAQMKDLAERIESQATGNESLLSMVEGLTESVSPVMAPNGVPVYRVDRGGEVTFHGPSQLVVYPMLDLKQENSVYKADLHWYLRRIEDVILLTLQHYGIDGNRDAINTGVWVGPNKIAAVGISSSRWITTHGFALNVNPDLSCFDTSIILPCGIEGRGVTSMAELLTSRSNHHHPPSIPNLDEVADVVTQKMQDVFGVSMM